MIVPPEPVGNDFRFSILAEVNQTPNLATYPTALALVCEYLRMYAEKASVKPALQKLYAKKELLTWLMGYYTLLVDVKEGDESVSQSVIHKNYLAMQQAVTAEIAVLERQHGSTLAVVGPLITTVPMPSPNYRFPANSPVLLGDPNYPFWRRR